MSSSKKGDGFVLFLFIVSLALALVARSVAGAIVFAVLMVEDCFTRWLEFKKEQSEGGRPNPR